jgi:hypothetical protein
MRKYIEEVEPKRKDGFKPYNWYELINNSYGVQEMVLREVGMDENSAPDWGVDHDRMLMWYYDEFRALCRETWGTGELGMQDWLKSASKKDIMEFGTKAIRLDRKNDVEITGFRVIRNSNVSSGYPVYTLQAVVKK